MATKIIQECPESIHGLDMATREAARKASVCIVSGRNNLERELRKEIPADGAAAVNAGVGMLEEHPGSWCGQSKCRGQTQIVPNFNLCRVQRESIGRLEVGGDIIKVLCGMDPGAELKWQLWVGQPEERGILVTR